MWVGIQSLMEGWIDEGEKTGMLVVGGSEVEDELEETCELMRSLRACRSADESSDEDEEDDEHEDDEKSEDEEKIGGGEEW